MIHAGKNHMPTRLPTLALSWTFPFLPPTILSSNPTLSLPGCSMFPPAEASPGKHPPAKAVPAPRCWYPNLPRCCTRDSFWPSSRSENLKFNALESPGELLRLQKPQWITDATVLPGWRITVTGDFSSWSEILTSSLSDSYKTQVADTRPVGRIRPSTLFCPPRHLVST